MGDAIWLGPLVAGVVFAIFFGLLFPPMLRWMSKDHTQQVSRRPIFSISTGVGAGVLFGCFMLLDKLIEAGSVGPAWSWVDRGVKLFGLIAALGGVLVIAARLLRGRA